MITRRVVANLVAFVVLSAALVAYGFFDLLGNPLAHNTTVSTVLPSAAGLSPNFDVTLDGVDVGTVKSVSLVPNGAKVTMSLYPGSKVPSDVQALVAIANPLGEQEVQLVPKGDVRDPDPQASQPQASQRLVLRNGAVIPAAADSTPADVGVVVAEATKLLRAIPAGSLDELLHDGAVALNSNVGSLRTIASASELFSQEFLAQQQQFESLLSNAPPVLNTVTDNASALQQGLADTEVLTQVFANHAGELVRLFSSGSDAASALQELVSENEPDLGCIVNDQSAIAADLGGKANLQNLSTALSTNQLFFGAVGRLAVTGPAIATNNHDASRGNQEWLRTRLLIPGLQMPTQPQPIQYANPTSLPPVLPGAGCDTEFGAGASAPSQPGFAPAGPGAKVIPATATESQVRGGGTEPASGAAPASAKLGSGGSPIVMPMVLGMALLGWLVTLGHRRSSRSARPLHMTLRNNRRRFR